MQGKKTKSEVGRLSTVKKYTRAVPGVIGEKQKLTMGTLEPTVRASRSTCEKMTPKMVGRLFRQSEGHKKSSFHQR